MESNSTNPHMLKYNLYKKVLNNVKNMCSWFVYKEEEKVIKVSKGTYQSKTKNVKIINRKNNNKMPIHLLSYRIALNFRVLTKLNYFTIKFSRSIPKMNTHKGVTIIFAIKFSRSVSFREKREINSQRNFRAIRYSFLHVGNLYFLLFYHHNLMRYKIYIYNHYTLQFAKTILIVIKCTMFVTSSGNTGAFYGAYGPVGPSRFPRGLMYNYVCVTCATMRCICS